MSNKNLTILAVVAAVMVALAVGTAYLGNPKPTTTGKNANLVQGFDTAKIATVILISEGEETKITQSDGKYVLTNKDNYPALVNEINGLVNEVLDIKTVELITSNPKNHADLGVTEEKARFVVKFLDKDAKPIEGFDGVAISESDPEKQGIYVRLLASDDVYLIAGSPWPKMSGLDYVDKRLTGAERDNIKIVKVTYPDGGYTLKKDDAGKVVLEEAIPEGKKLKGTEHESVFNALASLQFTDVQLASKATDLAFDTTFVCELGDTTVYTLKIAEKGDETFVMADAVFTGDTSVTVKTDGSETAEELEAKKGKLEVMESARNLHDRHTGWVYEISSWKAGEITKKLDDLLEDIPEEEKPKEPQDPNQP
jgi:hypothetical protein